MRIKRITSVENKYIEIYNNMLVIYLFCHIVRVCFSPLMVPLDQFREIMYLMKVIQ